MLQIITGVLDVEACDAHPLVDLNPHLREKSAKKSAENETQMRGNQPIISRENSAKKSANNERKISQ